MTIYFSASSEAFYDSDLHTEMPQDAVEVGVDEYQQIQKSLAVGYLIGACDKGHPILNSPKQQTEQELSADVRFKRDKLLADTDYLLMPDYPISSEKLALVKECRQKLRDITKQSGFPVNIEWPKIPE